MSDKNNGFVRVMLSHDYNQFEVCLPLPPLCLDVQIGLDQVDRLRKEAARLVDKAVRQYEMAKQAQLLSEKLAGLSDTDTAQLDEQYQDAMKIPVEKWTPQQKAIVSLVRQRDYESGRGKPYDYDDDYQPVSEFDNAF